MAEREWMIRGKCVTQKRKAGEFIPTFDMDTEATSQLRAGAKEICNGRPVCVVREECLEYALRNRIDFGVLGGKSELQRRKILRARDSENS